LRARYIYGNPETVTLILSNFEQGDALAGDYQATLSALQSRISQLQLAQIVHRKRAIIIVEGWEGAGKNAALKRLVAALDPCHVATHCVRSSDGKDEDRHWLARFWGCLPTAGQTVIFEGSWYRLLADRYLAGELDEKALARACDEINEFEAQQRDHGTLIVKLFFHLPAAVQVERLRAQGNHPWRRWLIDPTEVRGLEDRDDHVAAWEAMFAQTDTRWSPWRVIDASDKRASRISALGMIADAYEKAVPQEPPATIAEILPFPQQKSA